MTPAIGVNSPLKAMSPLGRVRTGIRPELTADEFVAARSAWTPPKVGLLLAACSLVGCAPAPVTAQVQLAPATPVPQETAAQAPTAQLLEDLDGKEYLDYVHDLEFSDGPTVAPEAGENLEACPVRLCSRVLRYDQHIQEAAQKYQVDPNLIRAVIAQESQGFPNAGSPKGARGLMQLMPDTARVLGVHNRSNAHQSVMGGTRYLAQLLRDNGGDVDRALWAYNAGPGNLAKGVKPTETRHYIPAVREYARQFELLGQDPPG